MKKIITFLYLLILAYACYDDKGNYDYREINQISIQNIDSLVLCDQMDLLSIPVTLEGTQYSDSNRFTYMWEVNQKVVATTKDLNVYANFPLGINTARFVVTDKELGTKAFKNFRINVSSSTAGDGILVLSKYQGHAELSFKRLDREGSTFTPNYYEALTGNRLGTNPRKIHRCYIPEAANVNSGLKIETDQRLKCLSEETLVEIGENKYLDHNFFISRAMTLPPDITEFDVKACWHLTTSATTTSLGGYIFVIANDELWHDQRMAMPAYNVDLNMTFMQKASPWHGQLSPVMFLASLTGSGTQNYRSPELLYLFDESEGQFIYANVNSSAANRACSELGIYAGYSLLYGTHTASPNQAVAVLGNGSVYRMLYLKLPSKTSETAAVPFTVLADVIVPGEVINSGTSYYPMKNESYMFFATDNGLYRYNLRDLENGNAPGSQNRIMTLTDFGYNADDKITCMTVSRTEQEILLGISRYGEDTEGMGEELKGDVLVLDLKTMNMIRKYEGVAGYPVDLMVKYQKFLRDGKENGVDVSDVLYF